MGNAASRSVICAAALVISSMSQAAEADRCGKALPDNAIDNSLYVLKSNSWLLVKPNTTLDRSWASQRFAYVINDHRDNDGGVVLLKTVDYGKVDVKQDKLGVALDRDEFKRSKGRAVPAERGLNAPLLTYQDAHENNRNIKGNLKKFHSPYLHKGNTERKTADRRRRKAFVFEEFKLIYKDRSPILAFLIGRAVADVGDTQGVSKLRAALKYYGRMHAVTRNAVCFSLAIGRDTIATRIHVQDFDYQGMTDLGVNPFVGRKRFWEISWK